MEVGKVEFGPNVEHVIPKRDLKIPATKKPLPNILNNLDTQLFKGGHPRFNELLIELSELHARKNSDYSGDNPLANLKECENYGVPAWKGVLIRLSDKYSRIKSIVKKGSVSVKDESLIDTLRDQAVYSLLAIILMEEDQIGTPTAEKKC
jgi:hypothetical protein